MLMECATGRYPFHEHANCIEVAQIILDADIPDLPRGFTPSFSDFLMQCLHKDSDRRLPAEVLLGSPWLAQHMSALTPEVATENVYNWIRQVTGER